MEIEFTKMHGAGNDYIYVNTLRYPIDNPEELSVEWSRYHTGIGSDGLVLICPSDQADFKMRIFNADGSEARMCGNASRCIGKYLYEEGLTNKTDIQLETLSGIKILHLHLNDKNTVESVTVDMGIPTDIHEVALGEGYIASKGIAVSMGNPHLVIFVDEINKIKLEEVGPALEHHPLFPRPGKCRICSGSYRQQSPDESMGTRLWNHSGMRYRSMRHSCSLSFYRPMWQKKFHRNGWRNT